MSAALSEEQEQAVARRSGPLLLSAGAGSGKTSVLVERFVRAVREDGVAAGRILAITFTDRAAFELRERVRERLRELGERVPMFAASAQDTEAAFVGTFHGFCARVLRAHPLMAGLPAQFAILDEGLAGLLRERAFRAALVRFYESRPGAGVDLVAAYGADRVQAMVTGVYAELRSRGQASPRLAPVSIPARPEERELRAAGACALLGELLEGFDREYAALKRARGAVDFDDLELRAGALLGERESVRRALSERFELLMVDEFQDTNPRQLAILSALERENLFTVGDERQAIYGFRHADVRLFAARRALLAERGASLELARNYRSRRPLLDVVNAVFQQRFGSAFTPLVAARAEAPQAPGEGPAVELLLTDARSWSGERGQAAALASERLPRAPLWRHAEARLLAQRVAELIAAGQARAGEVVLLLRALGDMEVYERALRDAGLGTLAAVGGFWGRQEVGDLLGYLRALANPLDELALYGVLASPLVGCTSDTLARVARAAQARGAGRALEVLCEDPGELYERLPRSEREALSAFAELLVGERRAAAVHTISELLERVLSASGYREHVAALPWGERRLANINKLLAQARRFEAGEGRDLRGFLDYAAHLRDGIELAEADAAVAGAQPDAVRLMSIHAAKGLEFEVVCIADLGRAPNTWTPDLLVEDGRVGLRLLGLDGEDSAPALAYGELAEQRALAQAREEERILYVAMTRARERLLLSGAVSFERWPSDGPRNPPIGWLGRALDPQLPAITAAPQQPVFDLILTGAGAGAGPPAAVRCRLSSPAFLGSVLARAAPGAAAAVPVQEPLPLDFGEQPAAAAAGPAPRADGARGHALAARAGSADRKPASPPGAIAGAGETLSYTALSALERCGYRFYLERVLRLPETRPAAPPEGSREGLDARVRGTLVHELLEGLDFRRPEPPSGARLQELACELGVSVRAREREEILGLAASVAYAAGAGEGPAGRVAGARSVRTEHPFAFALGADEPLVGGVIDVLAQEDDGGRLVIDYKSDRVGPDEDLQALLERDYELQRLLYALAVLRAGAPSVEVVHWFLERPGGWVGARYPAADLPALEDALRARIRAAHARMFAVSEHPHRGLCETCPGRAGLCSWPPEMTLRESPAD